MTGSDGAHKFDHVVSVMFENRSFDNLLGHLYEPGEVASFEGVAGRELSNPIPSYAPGAERGVVPLHVATSMDAPNPDAGEEHPHTNTQLFGTVAPEDNRFQSYETMQPPFNAPDDPGREPTMDGFVLDYVNTFRSEMGRLPEYDEYAQIMSCYTPEQVPVISTIAKGFATFDHWFCEVPSQTFTNRSFYHAASASGLVVNVPYDSFPRQNDAETIFERLDAAGLSWRVYVDPGMPMSITGMIHTPRLSKQFATNFSTHDDFFDDAEQGTLPAYSFLEPNLLHAHNDYHPAYNAIVPGLSADPPSSILGGEELLARVYSAIRASSTDDGSNFANTLFLVAFDEHGGNYDHVPPPRVPPPDPAAPAGQMRLSLRPLRHPHPHPRRLRLHRATHRRQRRIPQHLADPNAARALLARAAADRTRRHRRRHRPHPHPDHPPRPGGLARGHRARRAVPARHARPAGQTPPAARQVPPRRGASPSTP